jgi:tartrate dehydratase alpha subunit/fumarate hydratase class I-like protein
MEKLLGFSLQPIDEGEIEEIIQEAIDNATSQNPFMSEKVAEKIAERFGSKKADWEDEGELCLKPFISEDCIINAERKVWVIPDGIIKYRIDGARVRIKVEIIEGGIL